MMKMVSCFAIVGLGMISVLALAQTAQVPAGKWDGTYKLDYDKSELGGDSFTMTKSPDGTWHMISDAGSADFVPDGKAHQLQHPDRTQTATMEGPRAFSLVLDFGKATMTIRVTVSADGKTLTSAATQPDSDGAPMTVTTVSGRNGAGEGFFGKWTSTRMSVSGGKPNLLAIKTAADGTMTWHYVTADETLTGKPDGTPLAVTGPNTPPGDTIGFSAVNDRRMDFVTAHEGKTETVGYFQLSEDGIRLDDTYWDPKDPSFKQNKVYIRQ
jgi:hypothetical protein